MVSPEAGPNSSEPAAMNAGRRIACAVSARGEAEAFGIPTPKEGTSDMNASRPSRRTLVVYGSDS
jgi:hypothetical protein